MFKILSVYQIFHFQRTCICPRFGIAMQNTLKVVCLQLDCALIFPCLILSKWNVGEKAYFDVGSLLWKYRVSVLHGEICTKFRCGHLTFKVLVLWCCALDFPCANAFQSVLNDDAKTWVLWKWNICCKL